jgi:hypothetical protein
VLWSGWVARRMLVVALLAFLVESYVGHSWPVMVMGGFAWLYFAPYAIVSQWRAVVAGIKKGTYLLRGRSLFGCVRRL